MNDIPKPAAPVPAAPLPAPAPPQAGPGPSAEPAAAPAKPVEIGGPKGPEPTRYGDWEINGRCVDF